MCEVTSVTDRSGEKSDVPFRDGLMRIPEVCEFLQISRSLVYELMGRGLLPSVKIGRTTRIPRNAVLAVAQRGLRIGESNGR